MPLAARVVSSTSTALRAEYEYEEDVRRGFLAPLQGAGFIYDVDPG
jgi:hypothetical protein